MLPIGAVLKAVEGRPGVGVRERSVVGSGRGVGGREVAEAEEPGQGPDKTVWHTTTVLGS